MSKTRARAELILGGDPDESYPVPSEAQFKSEGAALIEASDLAEIGVALIRTAGLGLDRLSAYRIGYVWAAGGGTSGGKPAISRSAVANAVLKYFGSVDAVITLSAKHARELAMSRLQIEAMLCHALCHIDISTTETTGEERMTLAGHDAEFFRAEITRYGAWSLDLRKAASALLDARQMGFQFADPRADDAPESPRTAENGAHGSEHVADVERASAARSASGTDASAPAANGGANISPHTIVRTLVATGVEIAYAKDKGYHNPLSGERYSLEWAEGEYRGIIAGRSSAVR